MERLQNLNALISQADEALGVMNRMMEADQKIYHSAHPDKNLSIAAECIASYLNILKLQRHRIEVLGR